MNYGTQVVGGGMWAGWVLATGVQASASPTTPSPTLPQGRALHRRGERTAGSGCGMRDTIPGRVPLPPVRRPVLRALRGSGSGEPRGSPVRNDALFFARLISRLCRRSFFVVIVAPGKRPRGARPGAPCRRVNLGFVAAESAGGQGRGLKTVAIGRNMNGRAGPPPAKIDAARTSQTGPRAGYQGRPSPRSVLHWP